MASALKPPPTPFQLSRPSISSQPLLSLPGSQNGRRKTARFVVCSRRKPTSDHAMTVEILMKQVMEATRGLKIGRSPIIDQTTSLETLKDNIEKIEKIMGRKILEKGLDDVLDSDTLKERVKEILGSKTLKQWIEELGNSEALDMVVEKGIRSKRLKRGFLEAVRFARERETRSEKLKRPPLRPGKVSPPLPVPANIPRPPYVGSSELPELSRGFQMHDSDGIERMRAACQLAARVLEYAGTLVRPSVTTDEIDRAVHKMIIDAGAYPSPLGYGGFPKSVCTSVNECMCHGIPDSRPLEDGDIINIDVTVYLNGYHGDTSKTFLCGDVDKRVKRLVQVAEECLQKGIAVCKDGLSFQKIGKRISERAEMYNYGIVERFVGHGVGTIFHSEPIIHHIRGSDYRGKMVEGLTFTIEPILTLGSTECEMWDDNWTAVTADGFPAAQFEHTILITRTGAEILTQL